MNSEKTKGQIKTVADLGVMRLINHLDVDEGGRASV